jgi:hypothetical protein
VREDDCVFFYELKSQKALKSGERVPRGRMGIVLVRYVCGPMYESQLF